MTDIHVEAARMQRAIEDHLGIEGNLVFDYENFDSKVRLNLITINKRHNQSFLFRAEVGINKIDALQKMLTYVQTFREKESSYTLQWRVNGEKEINTSYFRAKNMHDVLDKFYYGRDMNTITVYSLVMNPVA